MSYADLWASMGLFAKGIVVVMFVMSAWSWAVSISKWIYLRKSQKETRKFAPEFSRYLQEEQLDGAIALAEKNKKSHVARVLGEALAEVKPLLRDRATITAADINSAERAVERQMLIITAELKRGLGILATTGATAPFVGLLGTTMGIVTAFQGMSASGGSGSLAAITGGVAEALRPVQEGEHRCALSWLWKSRKLLVYLAAPFRLIRPLTRRLFLGCADERINTKGRSGSRATSRTLRLARSPA